MEVDRTTKTLLNTKIFGVEEFGNEVKWRLDRPVAICVTVTDEIMIADAHHCVHVFDQRGHWLRTFGIPGEFAGKMQNILQICANKTGEFVVVAMKGRQFKFQLYDSNGNFCLEFGMKDAKSCHGIAIDKENRILSVDGRSNLVIFNRNGTKTVEFKCKRVRFPAGIGVNNEELIFIGDRTNQCVQVYTYAGLFCYIIGGEVLTPYLMGTTIRGQEDVLIAEIRQGKFCVSLFRQDGTWKSYSEAPEGFSKGVSFALLSNDNIVVTTKNNRAFIYEQTGKPRIPVRQGHNQAPPQLQHLQPDNCQASHQSPLQPDNLLTSHHSHVQPDNLLTSHQSHLQPDNCPASHRSHFQPGNLLASHQSHLQPDYFHASPQSHLQPDNFQASLQPHIQPDNFQASPQSHLLPDNFPAAFNHQHLGPGGFQAPYQRLLYQNTLTPLQHQHFVPGGSVTPSQHQHIKSNRLPALKSKLHPPSMVLALHQQNVQPIGSQEPFLTQPLQPQHLQPNMGHVYLPHMQYRQPSSSSSTFNDQCSQGLGQHIPVMFPNNSNELTVRLQLQPISGAPQQYLNNFPTVFAVPLRPNTVPFPFGGVNNNEQYSPRMRMMLESEAQHADRRVVYEQHRHQYQQKEVGRLQQAMLSQFVRETEAISEDLQALSLPKDGGLATPTSDQHLLLLDLDKGPLATSLKAEVDLNTFKDLRDHPLYSSSRPRDARFEAEQIQDLTCPLPLRYDKMFAVQNPAAPAIVPIEFPRRQHMSHCGYIKDFRKPCAVAVDSRDNVIVVDAGDNRVYVYNKHGKSLFSFGETGSGSGQLIKPRKVAADPQTRSIVVLEDTSISQIKIFCSGGKFKNSFLSNYIDKPRAMTVSKKSEIAVVQFSDRHVVMHELSGTLIRTIKCIDFKSPTGIAVGDYEFFISDSTDDCVKVYNFDGQLLHTVGDVLQTPSPIGVAIAGNGHVAVVDTSVDFRMTCFHPMGSFSAGYSSQKRHRNFEGFALTSTDNVVLICDDGKLWYYDTHRSSEVTTFCPEKWLTCSPRN